MHEEWHQWRLAPAALEALAHEYDVPAEVENFEDEWCTTCPHSDQGMMCGAGGLILGGTDRESRWLLERYVDGRMVGATACGIRSRRGSGSLSVGICLQVNLEKQKAFQCCNKQKYKQC